MVKQLISSFLPLDEMATPCRIDSKYISIGRPRYHKSQMVRNMQHFFIAKNKFGKGQKKFRILTQSNYFSRKCEFVSDNLFQCCVTKRIN